MDKIEAFDIFVNGSSFLVNKVLKQHWEKEKYSYTAKNRQDYGLLLVTHGQIDFVTAEGSLTAKAGDVIFIPKYSRYDAVIENEAEDYLINFDTDTQYVGEVMPLIILENASLKTVKGFSALLEERLGGTLTPMKAKGLFYLLLDGIAERTKADLSEKRSVAEKAMTLLQENGRRKICEIARECSISESGLRKIFKKETGMSLTDYRLGVQINRAKYLLESTDMSIAEISENLGFYDSAYFCKMFKKTTGVSPKRFAKNKQL